MLRTLVRNIFANWLGFAVQIAITFFLTPFVLHSLGEVRYGIWAIVMSLTGYYGFLDLGFRASLTQYITRHLATKDFDELNRSASTGFVSCAWVGGLVFLASVACSFCVASLFTIPAELLNEVRWAILIVGVGTALQFPFFVFSAVYPATQRYDLANIIGVTTRLVQAAGIIVTLRLGWGLIGVSAAVLIANLTDYAIKWRMSYRLIPELCINRKLAERRSFREFINYGVWNALIGGCRRVMSYTDVLLIGLLFPVAAVTPYALAASVVAYFDKLIQPFARVFFPAATQLHAKGDHEQLKSMYLLGSRALLLLAVTCGVIGAVWSQDFFHLWLGPTGLGNEYGSTITIFSVLMAASVITAAQRIGHQYFLGSLQARPLAWLFLIETCANTGISLAFAHMFGLVGIALGTLIAAAIVQGIAHPIITCRLLGISMNAYFRSAIVRPAIVGASLWFALTYLHSNFPTPEGWSSLILYGLLAALCSVTLITLLGINNHERQRFLIGPFRTFRQRLRSSKTILLNKVE